MANNNPYALDFSNSKITISDQPHIQNLFSNGGTIQAIVKARTDGGMDNGMILAKDANDGWWLRTENDNGSEMDLAFIQRFSNGGYEIWRTTSRILSRNTPTNVSVSYNSNDNQPKIYINGEQVSVEGSASGKVSDDSGSPLYIGERDEGGKDFDGIIDEIRIWNRSLTQEEIKDKMNKYLNPSVETGLLAYYRMDDNSDITTLVDATENNNHGTINGATYVPGEVDLLKPYKHLILDGTDIKTYNDGWSTLCQKGNQTESDFLNNGIDTLSNIPLEDFQSLTSPEVITYVDDPDKTEANLNIDGTINYLNMLESSQPKLLTYTDDLENTRQTKLSAIPNDQLIIPNSDIDLSKVDNIDDITLNSNLSGNGDIKIVASKDKGDTWQNVSNGGYSDDLVPTMTDYTSPEGEVDASSYYDDRYHPWQLFCDGTTSFAYDGIAWQDNSSSSSSYWISYKFNSEQTISQYTLQSPGESYVSKTPKDWKFEAYDGSKWVVLDERTNEENWDGNEKRVYQFNNDIYYKKYRLYITDNNVSPYTGLQSIEMMQQNRGTNNIDFNKTIISTEGTTPQEFNNITSTTWNDYIGSSNTLRFAYYLDIESEADIAETDLLQMQVDLQGDWSNAIHMTDYDYEYTDNNTITVDLLTDGSYKISYQK